MLTFYKKALCLSWKSVWTYTKIPKTLFSGQNLERY